MPKLAIIGAGPAGLVSAKKFIEQGFEVVIFEKQADIGGLWNPQTGVMWDTMETNLSKDTCRFDDLDWPSIASTFPSRSEMFSYLEDYTCKFMLRKHIRFNTEVKSVSRLKAGNKWQVNDEVFDHLVIASGFFSKTYIPKIAEMKDFSGRILHSSQYKSASKNNLVGKRVAVFGSGFSAAEIAADLAEYSQVTNIVRTPSWIIPRMLPNGAVDDVFYNQAKRNNPSEEVFKDEAALLRSRKYMGILCPLQTNPKHPLYINPNLGLPAKVAISDHYMRLVSAGKITISSILESKKYDAVIFCTGFKTNLDFLSIECKKALGFVADDQFQPVLLHKCTFNPELPNLAFVGMYRGPYFRIMELQAELAAKIASGKVLAPSINEMRASIKQEYQIRNLQPRPQFPHADYVGLKYDLQQALNKVHNIKSLHSYKQFIKAGAIAATVALGVTSYYAYHRNTFKL